MPGRRRCCEAALLQIAIMIPSIGVSIVDYPYRSQPVIPVFRIVVFTKWSHRPTVSLGSGAGRLNWHAIFEETILGVEFQATVVD